MAPYELSLTYYHSKGMSEGVFPTDAMDSLPLGTKNTEVLATPMGAHFSQAEAGSIGTEPR